MKALANVCPLLPKWIHFKTEKFASESIYGQIEEIAPRLQDILLFCMWAYFDNICYKIIVPIMTEDGLCFTFNAMNSHEMYTDE